MFDKVLIANRGEIALRVARACRELGVKSVAVYSTADAESAVVRFADEAVQIGPPAVSRSYLHIPSLIGAALKTGADAIHPGYGFLSEDPYFAEICADQDITFIGPRYLLHLPIGEQIGVAVLCICLVLATTVLYNRRRARRVDTSQAAKTVRP